MINKSAIQALTCKECNGFVADGDLVGCDLCGDVFHAKCKRFSESEVRYMKLGNRQLKFYCDNCDVYKLRKVINDLEVRLLWQTGPAAVVDNFIIKKKKERLNELMHEISIRETQDKLTIVTESLVNIKKKKRENKEKTVEEEELVKPSTSAPSNLNIAANEAPELSSQMKRNVQNLDEVTIIGPNPPQPITCFEEAKFRPELFNNIKRAGFVEPTLIQSYAIPIIASGRDFIGLAAAGSGKTGAVMMPIVNNLLTKDYQLATEPSCSLPYVVVVAPATDVALSLYSQTKLFSFTSNIKTCIIYNGTYSFNYLHDKLMDGCHILISTLTMLMEFVQRNNVSFRKLKYLVLADAELLLQSRFFVQIEAILTDKTMPDKGKKQVIITTSAVSKEIQAITARYLQINYLYIAIGVTNIKPGEVEQCVFKKADVDSLLEQTLRTAGSERIVIFVKSTNVSMLVNYLSSRGFKFVQYTKKMTLEDRQHSIREFRSDICHILVTDEPSSRILTFCNSVQHVINYDLPENIEEYSNRVALAGRLGRDGKAIGFFDKTLDNNVLTGLLLVLKREGQEVPAWLIRHIKIRLKGKEDELKKLEQIQDQSDVDTPHHLKEQQNETKTKGKRRPSQQKESIFSKDDTSLQSALKQVQDLNDASLSGEDTSVSFQDANKQKLKKQSVDSSVSRENATPPKSKRKRRRSKDNSSVDGSSASSSTPKPQVQQEDQVEKVSKRKKHKKQLSIQEPEPSEQEQIQAPVTQVTVSSDLGSPEPKLKQLQIKTSGSIVSQPPSLAERNQWQRPEPLKAKTSDSIASNHGSERIQWVTSGSLLSQPREEKVRGKSSASIRSQPKEKLPEKSSGGSMNSQTRGEKTSSGKSTASIITQATGSVKKKPSPEKKADEMMHQADIQKKIEQGQQSQANLKQEPVSVNKKNNARTKLKNMISNAHKTILRH